MLRTTAKKTDSLWSEGRRQTESLMAHIPVSLVKLAQEQPGVRSQRMAQLAALDGGSRNTEIMFWLSISSPNISIL